MKPADITKAVGILRAGGLVAIPTETVYGLGADASNEAAIRQIFNVKERPYDHPLIVHVASLEHLNAWVRDMPAGAQRLAQAFWPGPLTMILQKNPQVLDVVTGSQDTIGVRIPNHPVALAVLQEFGGGVAAPSANKFTHISPTTAEAVRQELGDKVDLILDGGDCTVGLESTIVDLSGDKPVILRPGMLGTEAIAQVLGCAVSTSRQDAPGVLAPGMHHLHYAPVTKTVLLETNAISDYVSNLQENELPAVVVMHSQAYIKTRDRMHRMQMPNHPTVYAHDLYRILRSLDTQQYKRIVIEAVPHSSAWDAIKDRLTKAAGRRVD